MDGAAAAAMFRPMRRSTVPALLLALAGCGAEPAGVDDDAFVVIAGQSNAVGFNLTAGDLPQGGFEDPRTLIWDGSTFKPLRPGVNTGAPRQPEAWGPEVAFARRWRAEHPDDTLYIVKSARGSTGIANDPAALDWSPESGELFAATSAEIAEAKAALRAEGDPESVDAILWVQGEADAVTAAKAEAYDENLEALFAAMRANWGAEAHILFSQVSPRPALPFGTQVRTAQARVDQADDLAIMASAETLETQPDRLHYSAAGQIALGEAFYELYRRR